jgi:hypothetical protein
MKISRLYEIPISVDSKTNTIKQQFYVIPNLTETCLLGMDFITTNSFTFKGIARKLSYVVNKKRIPIERGIKKIRQYKVTLKGVKISVNEEADPIKIEDTQRKKTKVITLT